ncbi:MAG: sporulation protein YunB, partial [Oscillospiraceae bacterium]|nr:sporulation protein YunB [Oscillospiraceae bacterium]
PNIPVRIQSVTDVSSRFTNEFSAEGINQTRHKIMLEIAVDIDILVPGGHTKAAVTTQVAIAETIIVGAVPNVYAKAD